jgi:hypothetical protein
MEAGSGTLEALEVLPGAWRLFLELGGSLWSIVDSP